MLLASLSKINSEVDARVGEHAFRLEEITKTLEDEPPAGCKPLMIATKLLVTANRRLQTDLMTAKSDLQQQRQLVDDIRIESRTDVLTELLNRRAFNGQLDDCLEECERDKTTLSLALVDIDNFKKINDQYGHLNGDHLLVTVAQRLKNHVPVAAFVSRYGGEEFAIILPEIARKKALNIAEQLRRAVENSSTEIEGTQVAVTVSIGIAEYKHGEARSELIERTDAALYAAKDAGRNRCCGDDRVKRQLISLMSPRIMGLTDFADRGLVGSESPEITVSR